MPNNKICWKINAVLNTKYPMIENKNQTKICVKYKIEKKNNRKKHTRNKNPKIKTKKLVNCK